MSPHLRHPLVAVGVAVLLTVFWLFFWGTGSVGSLSVLTTVLVSGFAVLGASFLLAWGAETAEKDVPRAFALAVLAVLAVAPEYAVDALYAWEAGLDPGNTEAANLAVANMTGANRILIGIGWAGIALFSIYRARRTGDVAVERKEGRFANAVKLDRSIATEILFLGVATLYAFFVPMATHIGVGDGAPKLGIDGLDTLVLVGIYVLYIAIIVRGEVEEAESHGGVTGYLQGLTRALRIPVVLALFAYSGLLILTAVEPFAHGLESLGEGIGIPAFFMIQWIAPLASESPELVITAYLVNKARTTAAFNALISSKLNQWTLLVGTLVVVYSLALGSYGVLPFDGKQAAEIWLTAAQSLFALALLVDFRISVREALALVVLFVSQVLAEFVLIQAGAPEAYSYWLLIGFSALYILLALVLFARQLDNARRIVRLAHANARGRQRSDVEAVND